MLCKEENLTWDLTIEAEAADSEEISDHEKCIKQFAQNAAKNAKFHSSLLKVSLFIAKIAS